MSVLLINGSSKSETRFFDRGQALYVNRGIAIAKDLIFGLSVYVGEGWLPLTELSLDDLHVTVQLIDGDPSFMWKEELAALVRAKE